MKQPLSEGRTLRLCSSFIWLPQIQLIWAFDSSFSATCVVLCSLRISYITTYSAYASCYFNSQENVSHFHLFHEPQRWRVSILIKVLISSFSSSRETLPCESGLWAGVSWRLYFNADLSSSFAELKVTSLNKNARPTDEAAHQAVKPQLLGRAARPSMARHS